MSPPPAAGPATPDAAPAGTGPAAGAAGTAPTAGPVEVERSGRRPRMPGSRPVPADGSGRAARRGLRAAMVVVALLASLAAGLGAGVRSTHAGHAAVDEPEYLLTALSLAEDRDLDIADELADRRYLDFHDADLPVQTAARPDGSRLSPHDPLLPLLLAGPVGLGGWPAAKLTLAALAGLLAALTLWVAVRRFAVPLRLAAPGVALAATTAPLAVYGQQVYPELPAALAVTAAVAALTAPRQTRTTLAVLAAGVVALPWLSVKYVPVAAALAALALVPLLRHRRTGRAAALAGVLAAAGLGYAAVHRAVWGGWTAYASGDHFERSGELGVVGFRPDYPGRTTRLLGLLVDRDFGLAGWQPAWLLLVPAAAALLATRPRGWAALALPLAAGWATATWVALTMHGFWWPGRQLVVVLPLAVLVILGWLARLPRPARLAATALAAAGLACYAALLVTGYAGDTTWVLAPDEEGLHPPAGALLPDDRDLTALDRAKYAGWLLAAAAAAALSWRAAGRPAPARAAPTTPTTGRPAGRAPAASRR
jgi:hypothetical protein